MYQFIQLFSYDHSVHWVINPPQKHPLLLANPSSSIYKLSKAPFLGNSPLYIGFSRTPPLKVGFFSERPRYQIFSSLTPSYLLKVIKFLVKISQFEFLV